MPFDWTQMRPPPPSWYHMMGEECFKNDWRSNEQFGLLCKSTLPRYSHHVSLFTQLCHRLVCICALFINFNSLQLQPDHLCSCRWASTPGTQQETSYNWRRSSEEGLVFSSLCLFLTFLSDQLVFPLAFRYSGLTVSCLARGKSLKAALEQLNNFDR